MKATTNPPVQESSKQRALRIVLNYHRCGDPLVRSKYFWTFVASAAAAAYVGWLFLAGPTAREQLSPGPLAAVHSSLNSECAKCHQNFKPLGTDASGLRMLLGALGVNDAQSLHEAHTTKISCQDCHPSQVNRAHHSNELAADVASCAACHADHQGAGALVARPADRVCTDCHQDIANHRTRSLYEPALQNVARFAKVAEVFAHPGFRSLPAEDKNDFKFNHQLHLLPGQWPKDGKSEGAWKLRQIPADLQQKYRTSPEQSLDALVQLSCQSCHAADPSSSEAGAHMQPVTYEQHCQACHPLQVAKTLGGKVQSWPIRHGLKQTELREVLLGITNWDAADNEQKSRLSPNRPLAPLPIPGKTPGNNLAQQLSDSGQVDAWQKSLFRDQCLKCHTESTALESKQAEPIDILKPRIPERWFKHGRFNHRTHEAWANCRDCHAGAYASEATGKPPIDDQQVLIPNIDTCVQCHAAKSTHATFKAIARFDCAECHRYHPSGGHANVAP